MRLREHDAVLSKGDRFMVDPRLLKIDAGYNVRDLDAPDERPALDELKEQIRASGVRTPLEIRLKAQDLFIVAGHRRHKAVMELISEGEDIRAIPAMQEPDGMGEADRIANLVISNSGKPLTPLQVAEVVRRLVAFGWEKSAIAKRLGWKSTTSVNQYLDMLAMPEPVKEHVRKGEISATTARNLAKSELSPEEQAALIAANLEENKRIIGKKKRSTKVTKKTLKRDAKPPAEPPQDQEPSHVEPQSLPATGAIASGTPTEATVVAAPPQPLSGISENRVEMDAGDTERDQGVVQLAPPQSRNGLKELIDALLPFARMAEIANLDELADDYLHEVSNRDIKRAALAWFKATGETTTGNGVDTQEDRAA